MTLFDDGPGFELVEFAFAEEDAVGTALDFVEEGAGFLTFDSSFSICSMSESKSARFGFRDGCRGVGPELEAGFEGGGGAGADEEEVEAGVDLACDPDLGGTTFVFFSLAGSGTNAARERQDSVSAGPVQQVSS